MDTAEALFDEVYSNFKLHLYRVLFTTIQGRKSKLTTVETFCMEVINAMNRPTVNEFAGYIGISSPNAAYKVNNLVQKGYLRREQSEEDRREYHLVVTQKYLDEYNLSENYVKDILGRLDEIMSDEDREAFCRCLRLLLRAQAQEKAGEPAKEE